MEVFKAFGVLLILFILYVGFSYMESLADEEKKNKLKNIVKNMQQIVIAK